jgi:hypothetical protein
LIGVIVMWQIQEIELRKKPDVIVATPGRMLDHLRNAHGKLHVARVAPAPAHCENWPRVHSRKQFLDVFSMRTFKFE